MKELIEIIKTGSKEQVVDAQKKIEKFWQGILRPLSDEQKKYYEIFLDEINYFDEIKDASHQVYLINTLKWPFLVLGDKHFKFFADFIIKAIQNPSGKIRQSILHAVDWLTIGVDIEPPTWSDGKLTAEEISLMHKNKRIYFELVQEVEQLLKKYEEPRFNKFTYIHKMPSSVYKSLQYLITERLLRTEKYERMYQDFLCDQHVLSPDIEPQSEVITEAEKIISRQQILEKREEIEEDLNQLLKETHSDFSIRDIKDIIYEEEDHYDLMKIVAMFDRGGDALELENILELAGDAWNYFPHKLLGGISPAEKALEHKK
jgi:hypothetical protein